MDVLLNKYIILICLAISGLDLTAYNLPGDSSISRPFSNQEALFFKIHYGWFTIGKGHVEIKQDHPNEYTVEAEGKTTGLLGVFANLEDFFTAQIDKKTLKPIASKRKIKDGRYWRHQQNQFYHEDSSVHINSEDLKDPSKNVSKSIAISDTTFDILSSYLYLRSIDWNEKKERDSVMIDTFYGKKIYNFGVEYGGTEIIKYKSKKTRVHRLYVLFPKSSVFPDERPVTVWVSADENQLPLKIVARLGIGKATVELYKYENLKHSINYKK